MKQKGIFEKYKNEFPCICSIGEVYVSLHGIIDCVRNIQSVCLRRHVADLRSKTLQWKTAVHVIQSFDLLLLCNHGEIVINKFEVNLQETIIQAGPGCSKHRFKS